MKTIRERLAQIQGERERNLQALQEAVGIQTQQARLPEPKTNAFRLGLLTHGSEPPEGITIQNNWVCLDTNHMLEHLLVLGSIGSGKTQFLLRLAHEILFSPEDLDLYVVDGKGDPEFAKRIAVMAHKAGKGPVPIVKHGWTEHDGEGNAQEVPSAVLDAFSKASARTIFERLLAMYNLESKTEAESEFYRTQRRKLLEMVCGVSTDILYGVHIPEPPRSFEELQHRFTLEWLEQHFASSPLALETIKGVEKNKHGFYAQHAEPLGVLMPLVAPGGFRLGDSRVVVFSLNAESQRYSAEYLFKFIGECIRSYISTQPTGKLKRKTYWLIDEFTGFGPEAVKGIINQARSKGMSVTLAMLNAASMGEDSIVRESIKGCKTQIIFQHDDALELIRKAGTKFIPDPTVRMEEGAEKGISIGHREVYKIDPEEVRSLPKGACFISSRGSPIRMQVKMLEGFTESEFDENTMEDVTIRNDVLQPRLRPLPQGNGRPQSDLPTSNQPTPF